MKRLNKFGMSLAVVSVLSLGFSGCDSSSASNAFSGLGEFAIKVTRGDVYSATVTDSASPAHLAVQVEGTNEYKFSVDEEDIVFPVVATGGYVDVNGNGEIEADIDMKLNITMKSYTDTLTPVTTYIANEIDQNLQGADLEAELDAKLAELVDLVKTSTDLSGFTEADLLKAASETTEDAQVVINALYAEMVKAGSSFDLDTANAKANFEVRLKEIAIQLSDIDTSSEEASAIALETYIVDKLSLPTLTLSDVKDYIDEVNARFFDASAIKTVADLQGQTVYMIDKEADPMTYSEIKLPSNITTDTELEVTTYESVNGKWSALSSGVSAEATLDAGELTILLDNGDKEIKSIIDEIDVSGFSISTEFSFKITAGGDYTANFSDEESGSIYLTKTAEMANPAFIVE